MRKQLLILAVLALTCTELTASKKMDIKTIASGYFSAKIIQGIDPIPGTDQYARISDDGKQIIQNSFKTGKQTAVLFDVNKTIGEKITKFDGYILSPKGDKFLIQTNTEKMYRHSFKADYYIYTIKSTKLERLSDGGKQQVPLWSPDGNQIAFVRDNNLFLIKLLYDNAESQVTKDGKFNETINGIPDWFNEEEFGNNRSFCFNGDGTMLCWIKYDESKVKSYSLQMFKGKHPTRNEYSTYPGEYSYKYPKAGENNSVVSAWSFDIKSRQTKRLNVPSDNDSYMPRIKMTNDPHRIIVYTMNRHQDELNLYAVNPRSTTAQLLIKEKADCYIQEQAMADIIIGRSTILLPSDRDGYMQIYLYNQNGTMIRKIGDGKHDITSIYGYNEENGDVYYQAAALNPHDRQVFVSHKNGKVERLTDQEGWNSAIFSGDYQFFINTWSNYNTPYTFTLRSQKGKVLSVLLDNSKLKDKMAEYGWSKREPFTFTTSEGISLDGWMLKPNNFDPSHKYPVILFQYSGPGSQQVVDSWKAGSLGNGGAFDQYLVQQGFIVVCVDGRGTGGRGAKFEKCIYQQMGVLESKDQVETALWLGNQTYIDKQHIGIWGWSFGGFNTLMSMSEGRNVFYAGVAVAPPTDWRYYDTIYTERYMRTPKENPQGYDNSPIGWANKLNGKLLICHGLADDNVHPQNTFEYTESLIEADKDFSELLYTNRNHSIYGGNTRNHLMRQIANFFITNLK